METQVGTKLFVLKRIIAEYIEDGMDCDSLQYLHNALHTENDIEGAIVEFLESEKGAWSDWTEILAFALKLNSNKIPFKELCLFYIYEGEYENAVLSYYKANLELKLFLQDTSFYADYEESKLYEFLQELSSAYVNGGYYDIPKDQQKGFELLYNYICENYAILPEDILEHLLDVLFEYCTENELLNSNLNKLRNFKDFENDENNLETQQVKDKKHPKTSKEKNVSKKTRKKNKVKSFFKKIKSVFR